MVLVILCISSLKWAQECEVLKELPAGVYQLSPSLQQPVRLPDKLGKLPASINDCRAREQSHAAELLFKVLTRYHILLPLLEHDLVLNRGSKYAALYSQRVEAIEARTILRGAAMDALVTANGGDESILASPRAHELLVSPFRFFNINPNGRQERLAKAILQHGGESVWRFTQLLSDYLSSNGAIQQALGKHAEAIRREVFAEWLPAANPRRSRQKRPKEVSFKALQACSPTSVQQLLPSGISISFLPIASMLRETCNRSRGLPHADQVLRAILDGKTLTNSRQYPLEQTDPIRGENEYTRILFEHLPPAHLTTPEGISALLAYMGTGQCSETKGFLNNNQDIFWNYQRCVAAFDNAESANRLVRDNNRPIQQAEEEGKRVKRFISGMTRYEFPQVWGQPSAHLMVGTAGAEEKFQPIFNRKIQEEWKKWLGSLAYKDPAQLQTAEKLQWIDALNFVIHLGIKGFGRGLTSLQLVNNLCIAGVVDEPSVTDMVSWLFRNKDLGANKGLRHLGFQVNTFKDFHAAFLVVHGHLDRNLSGEDKKILHFGVIFVEHLLCKVSRWETRLSSLDCLSSKVGFGCKVLINITIWRFQFRWK